MGPELFYYAFKTYAKRWAFKHPGPADFFRTMEDASAVDLDWFWKGWFYSTDHVDLSLDEIKWYKMQPANQNLDNKYNSASSVRIQSNYSITKNFSQGPSPFEFKNTEKPEYGEFRNRLSDSSINDTYIDKNFYEVTFKNKGGLVMPIIIEWTFEDGSQEIETLPAEIWRKNESEVTKVFVKDKVVTNITIDPNEETADVNTQDNIFPRTEKFSKFYRYKLSK